MKKILAAIDFSAVSDRVVELAASLAQSFSAELEVVHVAAPDPAFVGFDAGPGSVRETRADTLRGEHRKLQEISDALRAQGLEATGLLIQGTTVDALLEHAASAEADTLVLGSHGRSGLSRVLVGSVSEGVLRKATCPVLVVPTRSADQ